MEKNVRLRLLYIMEALFEKTDEDHGLTMQDILSWLELHNLAGERKSIYEDLRALKEYGLEIEYCREDKTYRLPERAMELSEMKLLVDAIHASRFITQKRTNEMLRHVMNMASCHQRAMLKRDTYAEKPKAQSAEGFYSLDRLHEAIRHNRQITFSYAVWNLDKKLERKHEGKRYQVSPWLMIWAEENYYLVAYDEEKNTFKHFRVDKILDAEVLDIPRKGEEEFRRLDSNRYTTNHFGMFHGEQTRVTLLCHNSLIGVMLDRFGTDIQVIRENEEQFKIVVSVVVSPQFFAWIFGFGNQVKILTESVVAQMKEQLEKTASLY